MLEARLMDLTLHEWVGGCLPAVVDDVLDRVHAVVADRVVRQVQFLELPPIVTHATLPSEFAGRSRERWLRLFPVWVIASSMRLSSLRSFWADPSWKV